ncbi:MAG: DUF6438 domain-containing protein [Ignavibacteriales bacterium]|nr:DUF6438 domain-containing protein [Ignavibacteriales bacterium]
MKVFCIFLICFNVAKGQVVLEKTWIGPENWYMHFRNGTVAYWKEQGFPEQRSYHLSSDTLQIAWQYQVVSDSVRVKTAVDFYRIVKLSRDSLILSELPHQEYSLVDRRPKIFVDSAISNDTRLAFNRLTFSTTSCFGQCPVLKISIDSKGRVKFRGEQNTNPFIGSYVGQLPLEWMRSFVGILQRSRVEHIPDHAPWSTDAPVRRLRITFNGKTKVIEGQHFSPLNWRLFSVLEDAYKEARLVKVGKVSFER